MEFEVKMTAGILYHYLVRQYYKSISGIVGIAFGLVLIGSYFYRNNYWLIVAGIIVILYPPWSFFTKSKRQMLLNPAFKKPIHYHIDDEGVKVTQGADTVLVAWDLLFKVAVTKKSILVFTSPVNAWILPFQCMGDHKERLLEMIRENMKNHPKARKNRS